MLMKVFTAILLITLVLGCSSTRLVSEWKNPDVTVFAANKVMVLGITSDSLSRQIFEDRLAEALTKGGIQAFSGLQMGILKELGDDFDTAMLEELEKAWASDGFDAVLVSKVTGQEDRKSVVQSARGLMNDFQTFTDYYYSSRDIREATTSSESYRVYNAESSVFCVCPGQERNLVWRGRIDIIDPYKSKRNIKDYVVTLTRAMSDQHILLGI
jgi:hypothetical protein